MEDIIDKRSLPDRDKEFLFDYLRTGVQYNNELKVQAKDSDRVFRKNVVNIIDKIFSYGLYSTNPKENPDVSNASINSSFDEIHDSLEKLGQVEHYWDYMTSQLTNLTSVKYMNF